MDGGNFSPINPYLAGEILAASATATACAACVASYIRRQTVRRRTKSITTVRESIVGDGDKLLLSGEYRGRLVKMAVSSGLLTVTVRGLYTSGLFAEFSSSDHSLVPWLSRKNRNRLSAIAGQWSLAIRGKSVFLSCPAVVDPERLRLALDVTCDLADAVDADSILTCN